MTPPEDGKKIAVVLFNLGGPDGESAIEPFLFNLFSDPAIIGLPQPFRWLVAKMIAHRRAPIAKDIYKEMGGRSPILDQTQLQAAALQDALQENGTNARVFIAMRYWHPRANETVSAVKAFGADAVVLMPLYPQFSTTTTQSSIDEWHDVARRMGLDVPTHAVCCYPDEAGFVSAQADLLQTAIGNMKDKPYRVLFSAHGLPKRTIERTGDPYPDHVERSAATIVQAMQARSAPIADWQVCYQSRVGPLEWIGPSTEDEIRRAGADGVALVVLPIAFVSEHSETLVELDIEYRQLADGVGVPGYVRVPTVGTHPTFIDAMAKMVAVAGAGTPTQPGAGRPCARDVHACPARRGG